MNPATIVPPPDQRPPATGMRLAGTFFSRELMVDDSFPALEASDAAALALVCECTRSGKESAAPSGACAHLIELGYAERGPSGGLVATELGFAAESFLE